MVQKEMVSHEKRIHHEAERGGKAGSRKHDFRGGQLEGSKEMATLGSLNASSYKRTTAIGQRKNGTSEQGTVGA